MTSGTQSPQTRTLLITSETLDLKDIDSNILGDKIDNPTGATFNGTVISGYTKGNNITYTYDTEMAKQWKSRLFLIFGTTIYLFQNGIKHLPIGNKAILPHILYVEEQE